METNLLALLRAEIASGNLTGITDAAEFKGRRVLEQPEPGPAIVTDWGGVEVPELDELRVKYDRAVASINAAMEARGSSYRVLPMARFHVWNQKQDGDPFYAEALAKDKNCAHDNQAARSQAWILYPSRVKWGIHILDLDDAGRRQYPNGVNAAALIVEDHQLWHEDATPADMVAWYEREYRGFQRDFPDLVR